MNKLYIIIPAFLLITGLAFQSCKKTEYDYQKSPYNSIKQFTVVGSSGDSTKCFVSGDSITVYWDAGVPQPESIKPSIVIDGKAKISPASGESVPFAKTTVYTVTAEDGTVKTYYLNPVLAVPMPSVSSVLGPLSWISNTQMDIYGEHFLADANPAEMQVYMQRLSDGVEIPLELDANRITNYSLVAKLPAFSAEQDTGLHRVYVKSGNRIANSAEVRFLVPSINFTTRTASLVQDGQQIHTGDKLTINYSITDEYGGKLASYYHARNIDHIRLYFSQTFEHIEIRDGITKGDDKVEFTLPNLSAYKGEDLVQFRFIYKSVPPDQAVFSSYYLRGFLNNKTTVVVP